MDRWSIELHFVAEMAVGSLIRFQYIYIYIYILYIYIYIERERERVSE